MLKVSFAVMLLANASFAYSDSVWENIDLYRADDRDQSRVTDFVIDKNSNMYEVLNEHFRDSDKGDRITVRYFDSERKDGTTLDTFQYSAGRHTESWGIAVSESGDIVVSGQGVGSDGSENWFVRRGSRSGDWKTVMDFRLSKGVRTRAGRAFISGNNWYIFGSASDAELDHAIVRRSQDRGETWQTVGDWTLAAGARGWAGGVGKDGTVYASVRPIAPGETEIMESRDRGESWKKIDSYQYCKDAKTSWEDLHVTSRGDIFVSGESKGSDGRLWAIARRRLAATGEWELIDQFALDGHDENFGNGITTDPKGNVYVAIRSYGDGSTPWVVRRGSDYGKSFCTIDVFTGLEGLGVGLWPIRTNAGGELFLGGSTWMADGLGSALIRKASRPEDIDCYSFR